MSAVPFRPDATTAVMVHLNQGVSHTTLSCADRAGADPMARMVQPRLLLRAVGTACRSCGGALSALLPVLDAPAGGAVAVGVTVDNSLLLDATTRLVWSVLRHPLVAGDTTGWRWPANPAPWVVLVDAATAGWVRDHTRLPTVEVDGPTSDGMLRTAAVLWDVDRGTSGLAGALQAAAALRR